MHMDLTRKNLSASVNKHMQLNFSVFLNPKGLGILINFGSSNTSYHQTFQRVIKLPGTGVSQSKFSHHKDWSIVLGLIVNGEIRPKGSYMVALSRKINLVVQSALETFFRLIASINSSAILYLAF